MGGASATGVQAGRGRKRKLIARLCAVSEKRRAKADNALAAAALAAARAGTGRRRVVVVLHLAQMHNAGAAWGGRDLVRSFTHAGPGGDEGGRDLVRASTRASPNTRADMITQMFGVE